MARLPNLRAEDLTARQTEIARELGASRGGRIATGGPWGLLLHNEELSARAAAFGTMLRDATSVPTRLSELAIIVTARAWNAEYEWYAHAPKARLAGVPADVIEAIRLCGRPQFSSADEEAVFDFVRELHETRRVGDTGYQALVAAIGETGAVELTAIVGFYTTIAMLIVVFDPEFPAGVARPFPDRQP